MAAHKQLFLVVRPVPDLLTRKLLLWSVINDGLILPVCLQAADASITMAARLMPQISAASKCRAST
jgi:hypothetical protein